METTQLRQQNNRGLNNNPGVNTGCPFVVVSPFVFINKVARTIKYTFSNLQSFSIFTVILLTFFLPGGVNAHGEGNWNDFMIDNKNDLAETTIAYVKKEISDIVLASKKADRWPDPVLRQLKIELLVLQEELEFILIHLKDEDGIHIQQKSVLLEHPQAGRTVAATNAVEMAIELVDHIASLEDQFAFQKELRELGLGAYIFDQMDAFAETMAVYRKLQQKSQALTDQETVIQALSNRTVWQDVKFHLGRMFRWIGQDDIADKLQLIVVNPVGSETVDSME